MTHQRVIVILVGMIGGGKRNGESRCVVIVRRGEITLVNRWDIGGVGRRSCGYLDLEC